ncbi:hypothetical protein V8J88_07800 [Massilia sp. W12]|uniref:hypothetical protein n=1 Tax=Massilia sp. W12 TaxID=3126507 RepID=UPI0030CCD487
MTHQKIPQPLVPYQPADFSVLPPEEFEDFCVTLVRALIGVHGTADKYGSRGQADFAVDILARRADGVRELYQCKRYQEYKVADLNQHIQEFLKNLPRWQANGPITKYVLLVSCRVEKTELHEAIQDHINNLSSKHQIALQVWSGGTVEARLAPFPQIVRRFFAESWVAVLCNHDTRANYARLYGADSGCLLEDGINTVSSLLALLNTLPIHIEKIRSVFQHITHRPANQQDSLESMLYELDDYAPANPDLSNTVLLAVRLCALCGQIAIQQGVKEEVKQSHCAAQEKLQAWLQAGPASYAAPALTAEQERLQRQALRAQCAPIIVLQPFAEQAARAWYSDDGRQWQDLNLGAPDLGNLEAWLENCLRQLVARFGLHGETVIELVLPLDKLPVTCLGLEVEPVPDICYRLGESGLILLLRLQERWEHSGWHKNWRTQWELMQNNLGAMPEICWHPACKPACDGRWHWLAAPHDKAQSREFKRALYEGAPFALLCAENDEAYIREKFSACNYFDFHQHFQNFGNLRDGANHIHCLIDDPNRVPPGANPLDSQLRQPQTRS